MFFVLDFVHSRAVMYKPSGNNSYKSKNKKISSNLEDEMCYAGF